MVENGRMPGSDKINALLGAGTEFDGKLSFKGTVRIDGKFSGQIKAQGTLIVGEEAQLTADVFVDTLVLRGEMKGNVTATSSVELLKTGRIHGNITTPALSVEKGALFQGESIMDEQKIERKSTTPFQPAPVPPEGPKTI